MVERVPERSTISIYEHPVVRATGRSRAYYLGFLKPGRAAANRPFSATAEAALTIWLCFGIDPQNLIIASMPTIWETMQETSTVFPLFLTEVRLAK